MGMGVENKGQMRERPPGKPGKCSSLKSWRALKRYAKICDKNN